VAVAKKRDKKEGIWREYPWKKKKRSKIKKEKNVLMVKEGESESDEYLSAKVRGETVGNKTDRNRSQWVPLGVVKRQSSATEPRWGREKRVSCGVC